MVLLYCYITVLKTWQNMAGAGAGAGAGVGAEIMEKGGAGAVVFLKQFSYQSFSLNVVPHDL